MLVDTFIGYAKSTIFFNKHQVNSKYPKYFSLETTSCFSIRCCKIDYVKSLRGYSSHIKLHLCVYFEPEGQHLLSSLVML